MTNGTGEYFMVVENRNLQGVEVGMQLADLDSSCLQGHSEVEGSVGEGSLIQHGLPLYCNWLYYSCLYTSLLYCTVAME